MRVLVFGASGMLGSAMMHVLGEHEGLEVLGTIRNPDVRRYFPPGLAERLITPIDAANEDALIEAFAQARPEVVINCIGVIKQLEKSGDPLTAIPMNGLLPHRLARLCNLAGARVVHISTDCVFSGRKGNYVESDAPDATDLYGRSKYLGELSDPHAITLRTSIIGHELASSNGLISWFLACQGQCRGFTRAIFSGLPAVVLAQIVRDVIIPRTDLSGVYHVASKPISKFDLLELVRQVYGKNVELVADGSLVIDRSLNAERFEAASGYRVPEWPELVKVMHAYYRKL